MAQPTIVFAPEALAIVQQATPPATADAHNEVVGGLLIGKREGDRIVVVGATPPGPNPSDRRLGVALDVDAINAVLEDWFAYDPDVDIYGLWHTHPGDMTEPTLEDVAAAYTLREDGGHEVLSVIYTGDEQVPIRCFYLDNETSQPVGIEPIGYVVAAEGLFPPPPPRPLASPDGPSGTTTESPATAESAHIAQVYDAPVGGGTTDAPVAAAVAESAEWSRDETDVELATPAYERTARSTETRPNDAKRLFVSAVLAVVLVLIVFGLIMFFRGFAGGGTTPATAVPNAAAEQTTAQGIAAMVTAEPTEPPAPTNTILPTNTAAPSPTVAATPTEALSASAVAATRTTEARSAVATDASETATVVSTSISASASATPDPAQPYGLTWEPMTAAQRTAFLARARAAKCADCYNVDLIGPDPYAELRVRIDNGPNILRTYDVPSLSYVRPRAEAHSLQVFDADDKPVSAPLTVQVEPDAFYILRITAP